MREGRKRKMGVRIVGEFQLQRGVGLSLRKQQSEGKGNGREGRL